MRGRKLLNELKKINVADPVHVGVEVSSTANTTALGGQNVCGESVKSTAYEALEAGLASPSDEESDFLETLNFDEKKSFINSSFGDNDRIIASHDGEVFIYSSNKEHINAF